MSAPLLFPPQLHRRLIVSCQAPPDDPLDHPEVLRRMAISALRGGAGGLRANGPEAISIFRAETSLPIIGILKRYQNGRAHITPSFDDASAVARAGADVIALDCTASRAPGAEPWPTLIARIHRDLTLPVLADISTPAEALAAQDAGADAVATTLYGYTPETEGHRSVNWSIIRHLTSDLHVPLLVEGHIRQPEELRLAFQLGAYAVVVGAAITRPESIAAQFTQAIPPLQP